LPLSGTRRITFHCPSCKAEIAQAAAWLKSHPELTCPGCGAQIRIDTTDIAAGRVRVLSAAKKSDE
jgi:transcription initiation factor IIE alpha subunit